MLCPHVLGRKAGRFQALVYQIGGRSNSGLPVAPSEARVWRCLALEKLSQVELRACAWRSGPRASRQTCIDEVDLDTDALARRRTTQRTVTQLPQQQAARPIRSVTMECGLCRSGRARRTAATKPQTHDPENIQPLRENSSTLIHELSLTVPARLSETPRCSKSGTPSACVLARKVRVTGNH